MLRSADQQVFLDSVRDGLGKRAQIVKKGSGVWRAAVGHALYHDDEQDDDFSAPFHPDRMKPLKDRAIEGRANAKGIACFYCATLQATAIAETRPWIGSKVSVGYFEIMRELKIVNLLTDRSLVGRIWIDCEPPYDKLEERVWQDIDMAFTEPVERTDDTADYAPTQILAELIRLEGFDGVAYGSSLGHGHNLALFDLTTVMQNSGHLFEVEAIEVRAKECSNPYFCTATVENGDNA